MLCVTKLKRAAKAARRLLFLVGVFLWAGCDYHVDSVYLGRKEAKFLGHVSQGDLKAVSLYLDRGGDVNLQDEPGMTPLHHAVNADVRGSHLEMVKLLLQRGANVHAADDTSHTPLHLASHMETAQVLLDAGADVNARTRRNGETLLFSAAWGAAQGRGKNYETYLNLTKMLIARGADVNLKLRSGSMIEEDAPHRDKPGDTPLHGVSRSYSEAEASEVCSILIQAGARINEQNVRGHTPLDEALANERPRTADFLRSQGAMTGKECKEQSPGNPEENRPVIQSSLYPAESE